MKTPSAGKYQILWRGGPSLWEFSGSIGASVLLTPVLIGFPMLLLTYLAWRATSYVISDKKVGIERGIFIKNTRELRIADIRSIDIRRSGFGGLFDIGDIILSTAAHDDASIRFAGVSNAEAITDLIRECQEGNLPPAFGSELHSGAGVFLFAALTSILLTVLAAGAAHQQYQQYLLAGTTPTPPPTAIGHQIGAPTPVRVEEHGPMTTPSQTVVDDSPVSQPSHAPVRLVSTPAPMPSFAESVARSQKAAVVKHPRIGVAGSRENALFITRLTAWRVNHDPRLNRYDWPERLADDCATSP